MNISDVAERSVIPVHKLEEIFDYQEALERKYRPIEERNGVGYGILQGQLFDINTIRSQELLKNMAWRVTEELTEATVAKEGFESEHFVEEVIDAFHFLVALALQLGITPHHIADAVGIDPADDILSGLYSCCGDDVPNIETPYLVIERIGEAMNCLKQKPWKQTHILTDSRLVQNYIIQAILTFIWYCRSNQIGPDTLYLTYMKKNEVNAFRIKSNY